MSLQQIMSNPLRYLKQLWPVFAFFGFVMLTGIAVVHFVLDEQQTQDAVENLQVSLDLVGERVAHMKQALASDLSIQVSQKKSFSPDLSFSAVGMANLKKNSLNVEWMSARDEASKLSAASVGRWLKDVDPDELKEKGSYFFISQQKAGSSYLISILPFTVGSSKDVTWGFSVDTLPTSWLSFPRSQSLWILDDKIQTTFASFGGQHQGVAFRRNLDNLSESVAHHQVVDGEEWTWQKMKGSNLVVLVQNARAPWVAKSFWWLMFAVAFLVGLVPFLKYADHSVDESTSEQKEIPPERPQPLPVIAPPASRPAAVTAIPTSSLDRIHFQEMPDYEDALLEQALELKLPTVPMKVSPELKNMEEEVELSTGEPTLNDVVGDALANLSSAIQSQEVRVNLILDPELKNNWPATQLQSALEEVIKNSIESMEGTEVKTLTISGERVADEIHLCVEDTGVGMTDEILSRAQEAFFSTKVSSGKRRGLGLNVAKRLMEISGGRMDLESTPSVGTKVHLRFPEDPMEDSQVAMSKSKSDVPMVRKPTVRV